MLIRMWFDKAPMLFLIIAAVTFVLGLNLFAYLSLQVRHILYGGCHKTDFRPATLCLSRYEYPNWSARDMLIGSYVLVYISTKA